MTLPFNKTSEEKHVPIENRITSFLARSTTTLSLNHAILSLLGRDYRQKQADSAQQQREMNGDRKKKRKHGNGVCARKRVE